MTTEKPTFSPACTEPIIMNTEQRIRQLHKILLDDSLAFQRENVMFVLHLYEIGHLPKPGMERTWVLNGKVVDRLPDKIPQGSAVWVEVCLTSIVYYYLTYFDT
jgi:hypothetical protein